MASYGGLCGSNVVCLQRTGCSMGTELEDGVSKRFVEMGCSKGDMFFPCQLSITYMHFQTSLSFHWFTGLLEYALCDWLER